MNNYSHTLGRDGLPVDTQAVVCKVLLLREGPIDPLFFGPLARSSVDIVDFLKVAEQEATNHRLFAAMLESLGATIMGAHSTHKQANTAKVKLPSVHAFTFTSKVLSYHAV